MRVLVTGGVRSGKSLHAESLLDASLPATYVAPGPVRDDADWAARVERHRRRRPAAWATIESCDLTAALRTEGPVIVDCLGTWLTAVIDEANAWDDPSERLTDMVQERVAEAVAVMGPVVVLVTNEVGLGVVPEHRSGRVFRDLLGTINQRFGAACDEVHLVVAGRVLRLP